MPQSDPPIGSSLRDSEPIIKLNSKFSSAGSCRAEIGVALLDMQVSLGRRSRRCGKKKSS